MTIFNNEIEPGGRKAATDSGSWGTLRCFRESLKTRFPKGLARVPTAPPSWTGGPPRVMPGWWQRWGRAPGLLSRPRPVWSAPGNPCPCHAKPSVGSGRRPAPSCFQKPALGLVSLELCGVGTPRPGAIRVIVLFVRDVY